MPDFAGFRNENFVNFGDEVAFLPPFKFRGFEFCMLEINPIFQSYKKYTRVKQTTAAKKATKLDSGIIIVIGIIVH